MEHACRSSGHIDGGTLSSPQEESTFADGSVTFALQDANASGAIPGKASAQRLPHAHHGDPGARQPHKSDFSIPPPIPERSPSPISRSVKSTRSVNRRT